MHKDLLEYYKRELAYLRTQGVDFSRRYPKIASKLAFHGAESIDPHTERLVESVAFLAARVHRDLDRDFPQIAAALLDNLCPSLVQPVPSMTVAEFKLDPTQGKVTAGYLVPRHTGLYASTPGGIQCRFRTAWDTRLWPVSVGEAKLTGDSSLNLTLECEAEADFSELEIESLRFHIQGDWMTAMPLYDLLVSGVASIQIRSESGQVHRLGGDSWREIGYGEDEEVLPLRPNAQPAYGMMQEYFAFPRKFHFFELTNLRGKLGEGKSCDLALVLNRPQRNLQGVAADNFRLGCVPIVNLFQRTSEPILVDHRQYEYLLSADRQRGSTTEVHSILSVTASDPNADRPAVVPSFAAMSHISSGEDAVFWSTRREQSLRESISGTDVFLTFVDKDNVIDSPSEPVIYATMLCTNRRLAEQVPIGAKMVVEGASQSLGVKCLYEPSAQRDPPLGSETLWRLVSLLTLNHQSLVDGSTGADQLREMLMLFASDSMRDHEQIRGVRELKAKSVTARVGGEAWRGYCRGTEVVLEYDDDAFVGGSPLLMSAVLARFFAMYTSVNSFVRLAVRRGDEVWKQWEPMSGRQFVL
ncbi:MAG: type VI secretion system baseplate subunit TssF [Ramlibacter sp.]|nr:type VI secretion system baseplate subunit TssF [Ramlibacter sp.]